MPEFRLIDVAERPYLYVERTCSMAPEEISAAMGDAFQQVYGFMQTHGIEAVNGALSVYYTYQPDSMTFRAGFFISGEDTKKAGAPVFADSTPAGKVVTFTHMGPYERLRESYAELMQYLEREGLKPGTPTWEVYLNGPDETPEEELRTEVFVSLA